MIIDHYYYEIHAEYCPPYIGPAYNSTLAWMEHTEEERGIGVRRTKREQEAVVKWVCTLGVQT